MKSLRRFSIPALLAVLALSLTPTKQDSSSVDRVSRDHAIAQTRAVPKPEDKKEDKKENDEQKDDKKDDNIPPPEQKKCRPVRYICGSHKECPDGNNSPCWDVPDWCTREECN